MKSVFQKPGKIFFNFSTYNFDLRLLLKVCNIKKSYFRIYFISIIGYVIPKWIVVQEILQMRVLNVCIQLASLLSTLAIIKGKNYAFEKWDRFTLNTIEYRIEYYPDKVFCHFPIQFHKKICQIQM